MTNELVVGRFKGSDPLNPTFTKSVSLAELLLSITQKLPVDTIYYMIPHADGRGYSMREAGTVVIDVIPSDTVDIQEPIRAPQMPQVTFIAQPTQEVVSMPISPAQQGSFEPLAENNGLGLPVPKSQAELLAERGLEQPSSVKLRKAKRTKVVKSQTSEDIKDEVLPNPVSRSTRKVNSISLATPAQAAAASQFGKVK